MAKTVYVLTHEEYASRVANMTLGDHTPGHVLYDSHRAVQPLILREAVNPEGVVRHMRRSLVTESAAARLGFLTLDVVGPVLVNMKTHWELRMSVLCIDRRLLPTTHVCGRDFCDLCGDCMVCFGSDDCYADGSPGTHSFTRRSTDDE